jgi:hypothetical protein
MAKSKGRKLHKNILVAYARLLPDGEALCRQSSDTDEAKKGGGYVYFLRRTGSPMPPISSKFLIDNGLVVEDDPGLFDDVSQSFAAVSRFKFDSFREAYESAAQSTRED